jgi:hypothetical protein
MHFVEKEYISTLQECFVEDDDQPDPRSDGMPGITLVNAGISLETSKRRLRLSSSWSHKG